MTPLDETLQLTTTDQRLRRAMMLMDLAADLIEEHCPDELMSYDDAECDGLCLAEDLRSLANDIAAMPAGN